MQGKNIIKAVALAAAVLAGGAQAQAIAIGNANFTTNLNGWNPTSVGHTAFGGGMAIFNSSSDLIFRNIAVAAAKTYQLSFEYLSFGTGTAIYADFDNPGGAVEFVTANPGIAFNQSGSTGATGTYTFTTQAAGNLQLRFLGSDTSTTYLDKVSVTAVPEPETYAMMLAGLSAVGFMSARRRRSESRG